jgi:hypothetical protein
MDSINLSNTNSNRPISLKPAKPLVKQEAPNESAAVDSTGMTNVDSLVEQLMGMNEVRQDKIQKGLEILNNPNYLSEDVLDSVVDKFLADEL